MVFDSDVRAVFQEHGDAVYRFCWWFTGSTTEAEDITQEVFLLLLHGRINSTAPIRHPRSFLLGVARNLALKRRRGEERLSSLDEHRVVTEPLDVEQLDVCKAVAAGIAALPLLQREVLVLSAYEGLSLKEIAALTNVELSTVKARLHRARENMKRLLAPLKYASDRSLCPKWNH